MSSLNTPYKLDALSKTNEWAYGAGHFINDLSAALGFNFLLIYLKIINPVDDDNPSYYAGYYIFSKINSFSGTNSRRFCNNINWISFR